MSAQFDRGIFSAEKQASSWHNYATVGLFTDGASLVEHGYESGALPVSLDDNVELSTPCGLVAKTSAIVANYRNHPSRVVGAVGNRYRATTPDEFAALCTAISDAGAEPTGVFSLDEGSRVVATFKVADRNGLETYLMIADAFDGSMRFMCGFSVVDVVCSNTLAAAFSRSGDDWAKIRHTASAEDKLHTLTTNTIGDAIRSGQEVAELHERATATTLDRAAANKALDALAPLAADDAPKRTQTAAQRDRDELVAACALPINRRDNAPGTVSTLWNAATYLVDRKLDGSPRETRGNKPMVQSMLFGRRAERIEEIQHVIEITMADGTTVEMSAGEAVDAGVCKGQIGRELLADMLADAS